jgi:hypothetical protein
MMGPGDTIAAVAFFGMLAAIGAPVARAVSQRLGGGGSARDSEALRDEVADLRAELDDMRGRLGQLDELQERVDFAERALAQVKTRDALPGAR